jgi:hypothetical protein
MTSDARALSDLYALFLQSISALPNVLPTPRLESDQDAFDAFCRIARDA